jgi:hypothetical protein
MRLARAMQYDTYYGKLLPFSFRNSQETGFDW